MSVVTAAILHRSSHHLPCHYAVRLYIDPGQRYAMSGARSCCPVSRRARRSIEGSMYVAAAFQVWSGTLSEQTGRQSLDFTPCCALEDANRLNYMLCNGCEPERCHYEHRLWRGNPSDLLIPSHLPLPSSMPFLSTVILLLRRLLVLLDLPDRPHPSEHHHPNKHGRKAESRSEPERRVNPLQQSGDRFETPRKRAGLVGC